MEEHNNAVLIKNKNYEISHEIAILGCQVLDSKDLHTEQARIQYVKVYPHISKTVVAKCILANPLIKLFGECDYVIQVSGDLWDVMPEGLQAMVLHHEFLHISPVWNKKRGEWEFKIRDHDIQDFSEIITEYGLDWIEGLKALVASVYELDDEAETITL